jgi:DNA-binding transcriptional regulator LsrR (DeoR family)
MPIEQLRGPGQLVLVASVARRYYLDGKSKVEIAEEFQLSRFKVARLLELARTSGLVRIEIGYRGSIDVNLSAQLQERFRLRHAVVVDTVEDHPSALRRQVGRAAAELLTEVVTTDDVLGLGWSRAVTQMCGSLRRLASCSVVQLTGALSRPDIDGSSVDIVRDVARVANGPAYYFYAPLIVPDATTAKVLLKQPEVARAVKLFPSVTKAVVAIGSWNPPASTIYDAVSAAERKALTQLGVRADVSGVLLDGQGRPVTAPLAARMICMDAPTLKKVPEVLALAYGPEKATAVAAAIRGQYVNGVVLDKRLAEAILVAS